MRAAGESATRAATSEAVALRAEAVPGEVAAKAVDDSAETVVPDAAAAGAVAGEAAAMSFDGSAELVALGEAAAVRAVVAEAADVAGVRVIGRQVNRRFGGGAAASAMAVAASPVECRNVCGEPQPMRSAAASGACIRGGTTVRVSWTRRSTCSTMLPLGSIAIATFAARS